MIANLSGDDDYGYWSSSPLTCGFGDFFASLFYYGIFIVLPVTVLAIIVHLIFSIPLRRRERARFFLDLIETGLNAGKSVDHAVLSAAQSHDRVMGIRFYIVAAYLEGGLRLDEALEKVARFLPLSISAMLAAGNKIGDLKKVLPACREILRDAPAAVRTAQHYMVCILLVFSPMSVFMLWFLVSFVFPKFNEVMLGMSVHPWLVTRFVFGYSNWLLAFEITLFLLLLAATVIYLGGPQFVRHFRLFQFPIADSIAWRISWKRKRLQRTFSAMLSVLLDGGIPEMDAVRLAANCTANEICRRRAGRVLAKLQGGAKLDEAVRMFDDSGEFHWRLRNATHSKNGFLNALKGWHETLDARAFQLEEATAHAVTCFLVILNGVLVGLIAAAIFGVLISILNGALSL